MIQKATYQNNPADRYAPSEQKAHLSIQPIQISRLSIRFFKNLLDKTSHKN